MACWTGHHHSPRGGIAKTTQDLLRQQLKSHHDILDQTIGDCPQTVLDANLPGATITSAGSVYSHVVFAEDGILHGMLQGRPPVCKSENWAARTGLEMPAPGEFKPEWARGVKLNPPVFREYAEAVYAATDAFIAQLFAADLDRKVQTGFIGEQTVAFVLTSILAWHAAEHTGEIAALTGVQGMRGRPF